MGKEIATQFQKAQSPIQDITKENTPIYILVKLKNKQKTERKGVNSNKGKATNNIQGDPQKTNK